MDAEELSQGLGNEQQFWEGEWDAMLCNGLGYGSTGYAADMCARA